MDKVQALDRRVVFLFIALAVAIPLLFNVVFSEQVSPIVGSIFERVDNLPEGSKVLLSFDYSPSTVPEIQPMVDATIRHAATKNLDIYIMALWPTGQNIADETIHRILEPEFPDYQYGEDYVNIGYKSGNQGLINVILTDLKKMYTTDVRGTAIDSIPMMASIRNLRNFDMILAFGGGFPGVKEWVLFAGDPGNVPVAGGVTAVSAPLLYPYYPSQLLGLMGGIKGAAEYEAELMRRYPRFETATTPGLDMMGPQAVAHIVIMLFIVIGNVAYFATRKKQTTGRGA
ncbi:MAG: hypothetical protein GF341_10775 [candidate division Zixibacteria bacterium]|nr:hypothetical protein [candidate division Zixibacteria bacterium]